MILKERGDKDEYIYLFDYRYHFYYVYYFGIDNHF